MFVKALYSHRHASTYSNQRTGAALLQDQGIKHYWNVTGKDQMGHFARPLFLSGTDTGYGCEMVNTVSPFH